MGEEIHSHQSKWIKNLILESEDFKSLSFGFTNWVLPWRVDHWLFEELICSGYGSNMSPGANQWSILISFPSSPRINPNICNRASQAIFT